MYSLQMLWPPGFEIMYLVHRSGLEKNKKNKKAETEDLKKKTKKTNKQQQQQPKKEEGLHWFKIATIIWSIAPEDRLDTRSSGNCHFQLIPFHPHFRVVRHMRIDIRVCKCQKDRLGHPNYCHTTQNLCDLEFDLSRSSKIIKVMVILDSPFMISY